MISEAEGAGNPRGIRVGGWRYGDAVALALFFVVGGSVLVRSWGKWLEPVIDSGRDLYIPEQLAAGHLKLYRDILYNYPPLVPYLLAGIVRVFGSSLAVYTAIGITVSIATVGALYAIGRITTGSAVAAALPPLLFLSWNLTNSNAIAPGANYIFPYSYAATIGMLFLLVYMVALLRYCFVRRTQVSLAVALMVGGLAFWTKLEYAACVVVTLAVVTVIHRLPWRSVAAFLLALGGSFAALNLYFSDAPAARDWLFENMFKRSLLSGQSAHQFFSMAFGSTGWDNVSGIVGGALLTIALAAGIRLIQFVQRHDRWGRSAGTLAQVALVGVILLLSFLLARHFLFLRAWTLLQPLLLAYVLLRDRKSPLLLLLVFSTVASARVAFRLTPQWYGFVYTVPLYAVIAYVVFGYLPEKRAYSFRSSMLWLPLLTLSALTGIGFQAKIDAVERFPVVTPRGTFLDRNEDRAKVLGEFLRSMDGRRVDGMVVMPEGLTLNYLTSTPNPTAFYIFTPAEIGSPVIESRIIEELRRTTPELVILLTRDVREYGSQGFGIDYGIEIVGYLKSHYRLVKDWRSGSFSLTMVGRTSQAAGGSG